jgi:general secretion pathway protein H
VVAVAASGPSRPPAGYTLIELLAALVVVGIALGIATLQLVPDDRAALREESQRLALLLENAGLQARASGHPLAWSTENNGYRFWKKDDYGDWVRLNDDAMLRPRTLPGHIAIASVSVEAGRLKPGEPMPLGAASFARPFSIQMTSGDFGASITGNSTGMVAAQMDGEKN